METALHPAAIVQLLVFLLLYTPLIIFCARILWKRRHQIYFKKRYVASLASLLFFLSLKYTRLVLLYERYDGKFCILPIYGAISDELVMLWNTVSLSGIYITVTLRVWLLYFNYNYSRALTNSEWKRQINQHEVAKNFFIRYKPTLGSFTKMKYVALILYLLTVAAAAIMIASGLSSFSLNTTLICISILCQCIILYKTPKHDIWCIRQELSIFCALWITYGAWFGLSIRFDFADKYMWVAILNPYLSFLGCSGMICLVILYPYWHFEHISQAMRLEIDATATMSWTDFIAASNDNFDAFMLHLEKEWAVENMLFIIEAMQFKQRWIKKHVHAHEHTHETDKGFLIGLPDHIPKSEIVNSKHTAVQQMRLIYQKYIDEAAELQINVSFERKVEVQAIMKEVENNKELECELLVFDSCLTEIVMLMDLSWYRFRLNNQNGEWMTMCNVSLSDQLSIPSLPSTERSSNVML